MLERAVKVADEVRVQRSREREVEVEVEEEGRLVVERQREVRE